ncbi:uncharacterized protein BT62DRAFT_832584, partial [Guyanagaster necrorhizus]
VGIYHTDNSELKSNEMTTWLKFHSIQQQFTAPYRSAYIGQVKRQHHTLINKACAM